ncbi:MAG: hypothetical protein GXO82_10980 [Chlorobi bacterium]|nr:hypothetical protein [Chlorobiota bacterium]
MKIRHTLSWLAGATTYVVIALFLMGYENTKMHPAISETILGAFVDKFVHALVQPANLKNYIFVFDGNDTFSGPAVTGAGYFSSTMNTSTVSKTPKEWLKHGGYSADEPEVPAALRHFYDPLGIDGGKKYLTNRGTNWEFIINNNGINPRIDAMDWALHHRDNSWTWDKGKEWMVKALTTSDRAKRDDYMARAWRCLGETLHLIADMGCPPHVRNDSHAAPVSWKYRAALGDPDPFEELVKPSYAATYKGGAVDPALKSSCRAATSADEVFETMARFTNKHFFTNQTISGMGVKKITPIIDDRPAYPSPKLDKLVYDAVDYTFYQTLPGGQRVKMCRDKSWFSLRGYPYIDVECVESQAAALMPNIAEAGT